ncbi:MAG: hypothetical protein ACXVHS_09640 [Methanobacterium sp.]
MVDFKWEEIEEFQKQLKKIKEKSPDKDLRFIEFMLSEESKESMGLFYKIYFERKDEPMSDEELEELKTDFENKLLIGNCKLSSYFPKKIIKSMDTYPIVNVSH